MKSMHHCSDRRRTWRMSRPLSRSFDNPRRWHRHQTRASKPEAEQNHPPSRRARLRAHILFFETRSRGAVPLTKRSSGMVPHALERAQKRWPGRGSDRSRRCVLRQEAGAVTAKGKRRPACRRSDLGAHRWQQHSTRHTAATLHALPLGFSGLFLSLFFSVFFQVRFGRQYLCSPRRQSRFSCSGSAHRHAHSARQPPRPPTSTTPPSAALFVSLLFLRFVLLFLLLMHHCPGVLAPRPHGSGLGFGFRVWVPVLGVAYGAGVRVQTQAFAISFVLARVRGWRRLTWIWPALGLGSASEKFSRAHGNLRHVPSMSVPARHVPSVSVPAVWHVPSVQYRSCDLQSSDPPTVRSCDELRQRAQCRRAQKERQSSLQNGPKARKSTAGFEMQRRRASGFT